MRKVLLSILFYAISLGAFAQRLNIDSLFVAAPDDILPLLEHNSRLDLLDLYNCNMKAKVYNDLGGETCLLEKDSVQFYVQTSKSSFLQFRMLPMEKDTIFSCIRTVLMPEEQSQILFVDTHWHPINVKNSLKAGLEHYWHPSESLSEDRLEKLRLSLLTASRYLRWENSSEGTPVLVGRVSVKGLLEQDRKDALECLRPLSYLWTKSGLVPR